LTLEELIIGSCQTFKGKGVTRPRKGSSLCPRGGITQIKIKNT
jgi:hypothetical protein